MTTEEACGVPRSQRLRDTTGPPFQSWKTSGGLTKPWDDRTTARTTVSPTFHTHGTRGYKIRERQQGKAKPINGDVFSNGQAISGDGTGAEVARGVRSLANFSRPGGVALHCPVNVFQRMMRTRECSRQVAVRSPISQCFYVRSHRVHVGPHEIGPILRPERTIAYMEGVSQTASRVSARESGGHRDFGGVGVLDGQESSSRRCWGNVGTRVRCGFPSAEGEPRISG